MPKDTVFQGLKKFEREAPKAALRAADHALTRARDVARGTNVFKDRTGKHRRSLESQVEDDGRWSIVGVLRAGMPYSPFLELGTSRMSPRAHIRPSFNRIIVSQSEYQRQLKIEFKKLKIMR